MIKRQELILSFKLKFFACILIGQIVMLSLLKILSLLLKKVSFYKPFLF